jgi:hypothetical protein
MNPVFSEFNREGFVGVARSDWLSNLPSGRLSGLRNEVEGARDRALALGRHQVVVIDFEYEGTMRPVAVKYFGKQSGWKDRYDRKRGSKAARSFKAANFLGKNKISTPPALAYFERWEKGRLTESFYLSAYFDGFKNLRTELLEIYQSKGPCSKLVDLLEQVGRAIRRMHDAGFFHRDLGNQNIELLYGSNGEKDQVHFLDLNRGRIREELSMHDRARDFSRLDLPSEFLHILIKIYWQSSEPVGFFKNVMRLKRRFYWWQKSRNFRHPISILRELKIDGGNRFLNHKDLWIWDERSAQASITMNRVDRKKCHSWLNYSKIAYSSIKSIFGITQIYRKQMAQAYQRRVEFAGRIGMSLEPADLDFNQQLLLLGELGKIPVLLRFGHHEDKTQWDKTLGYLYDLHSKGHPIMVAVLQDRQAVIEPESWRKFLFYLFQKFDDKVDFVEVGHVINRVKWGIHNMSEYYELMRPVAELRAIHPNIQIVGPACIDFELHYTVGALDHLPKNLKFEALSHHLYVDRRGAPENKQGSFAACEKAALLKAVASHSSHCADTVIVSEVNWPIIGTGVWSPVAASYLPKGELGSLAHVSEQLYGSYMIRYLAIVLCSGFVERVYWWRLVAHGFGLVDERATGGWRKRVAFTMLRTFLQQLGQATFVEKIDTPEQIYAMRFERAKDQVVLLWCNGRTFNGPWPVKPNKVLDCLGKEIELIEIKDQPVYLINSN